MGNKEVKEVKELKELPYTITHCSSCRVPFTNSIEISTSATINKKVYTIHQHGENIVVSKFYDTIICKYKSDIVDNAYQFITLPRANGRGLTDTALETIARKIFVSENIMKFLFIIEKSSSYNIPLDVIQIIVKIWYNNI